MPLLWGPCTKGSGITRDVARLCIRKPLHFMSHSLTNTKPIFNNLHHQVSNKIFVDPFGRSHPAHYLPVTIVFGECHTNLFTVFPLNFRAVRTIAGITLIDGDLPPMFSRVCTPTTLTIKKQVVISQRDKPFCDTRCELDLKHLDDAERPRHLDTHRFRDLHSLHLYQQATSIHQA